MDREVMDMIDGAVSKLPVPNQEDYRLYEAYKRQLSGMFPGWEEYVCKALARRCGI